MTNKKYTFGLNTFGDLAYKDETKERMTGVESLNHIVKEAQLADELGIDIIALGEHHREEFSISAPEMVLAAMSSVTKNIKLGTAVTVLSSDDPVRVKERFATLDALSNGRAEVMLGRGSFTESFPLFGFDLENYEELFDEKLAMFDELLNEKPLTWKGNFTQSLGNTTVYPQTGRRLDVSMGVGGSPESIIRTAKYGYQLVLAIIGGQPVRFKPYIDLYKRAVKEFNQPELPVGMHAHGVIAETEEKAMDIAWKYIKQAMDKIGLDRGWAPMTRDRFEFEVSQVSYYVGTPETVAKKIAKTMKELGVERFDLVYGTGGQLQADRFETIRLYGEKVIPMVKELLKED